MNNVQRLGLIRAISYAYTLKCDSLHHSKSEWHGFHEPCPAKIRLNKDIEDAYKILKELCKTNKTNKKKKKNTV